MQWMTLFQKEILENWRNYKWIWVPLVITALMIMDPIVNYYLPEILDKLGGLPEGAIFEIPVPTAEEAIMMSLAQLGTLGILLFVLIGMGTITEERKSGVAEMILTKPVNYVNYVTSKWVSTVLLVLSSFALGLLMTWYYVNILYEKIPFLTIIQVFLFYSLILTIIVTVVIFFNTMFKSQGIVAFLSLLLIILTSTISAIFSHKIPWSPSVITGEIHNLLLTGELSTELIGSSIITCLLTITLLVLATVFMKRKEVV